MIEIKIELRCHRHRDTELIGEVDTKKGIGYVEPCPMCQDITRERVFQEVRNKLLGLEAKKDDIIVKPYVRKRSPSKKIDFQIEYHCGNCGEKVNPIIAHKDLEGIYHCTLCAVKSLPEQ